MPNVGNQNGGLLKRAKVERTMAGSYNVLHESNRRSPDTNSRSKMLEDAMHLFVNSVAPWCILD